MDGAQLKVVAVRDGEPVGLVRGAVEDGHAWLHSLWVSPAVRGKGLGTRLIAAVEEWAPASSVRLEVVPDNASAIALYRRLGYVDTGEPGELRSSGEHELVMETSSMRGPASNSDKSGASFRPTHGCAKQAVAS